MKKDKYAIEKEIFTAKRRNLWDNNVEKKSKYWSSEYYKRLTVVYNLVVPENSSVLEIGCGKGDLLAALNPDIGRGVDYSEMMIKEAQLKYPQFQFIVSDALELEYDGSRSCFNFWMEST